LISPYKPKNIYNAEETWLFCSGITNKITRG
jgi:hypothetical protein